MPKETYETINGKLRTEVTNMAKRKWQQPDFEIIEKPISELLDERMKEYKATGPDRSNLKQALKDLQKTQNSRYPNFIPKLLDASEEELQQRMRHADACMEAMRGSLLVEQEQLLCMYDTVDRLFGKGGSARKVLGADWHPSKISPEDRDDLTKVVSSFRGLQELLDLGTGPEAQERNDRVIMLMALNERKISEEDYRTLRESQLSARYPDNYQEMVQRELDHPFDELFDMIRQSVESKRALRYSPEMEKHRACIADVNETDPNKLAAAYDALYTAGCSHIAFVGSSMLAAMKSEYKDRNGVCPLTKAHQDLMKAWEDDECEYQKTLHASAVMSNPYSAILDPTEFTDFEMVMPVLPESAAGDAMHALKDLGNSTASETQYVRISERYQAARDARIQEQLAHAGMQDAVKKNTQHPEMHVYEKDGKQLILKNETDLDGNPHVRADIPGKLINFDLKQRLSELDERCQERDQSWGSKAYTEMRKALHAMQGATISDNPSAAELKALQQKLENVQQKVDAYMERKRRQRVAKGDEEVIGGKPYEQERIRFARELGAFTQDKLAAIESIRSHQANMQRGLDAAVNGPQEAMREPEGGDLHRVRTSIHEIVNEKNAEAGGKKPGKTDKKPVKKVAAKSDKKVSKTSDKKTVKKADKKASPRAHHG